MRNYWGKRLFILGLSLISLGSATQVLAFCGFFVATTDAKLENYASKVIIARDGDRTQIMMANDYQGNVTEFAQVVPIPVVPTRDDVRIGSQEIFEQIDDFTAPRLVEYIDKPCEDEYKLYGLLGGLLLVIILSTIYIRFSAGTIQGKLWRLLEVLVTLIVIAILTAIAIPSFLHQANKARAPLAQSLDVTVEDQFSVGEYDITILSAEQSNSLAIWLNQNGYQVPTDAQSILQEYIQKGMYFFVVKVNVDALQQEGYSFLRPLVLDYTADEFMLPIRLGMVNAAGDQDLLVFILSPTDYAEVANYRTVPIPTDTESERGEPSGQELPYFIKDEFGEFYEAMFQREYERQNKNVVFLEYAGLFAPYKCDPCSIPWQQMEQLQASMRVENLEQFKYVTRLHLRYNQENFPEDLVFQEVSEDRLLSRLGPSPAYYRAGVVFQGRYVIRRFRGAGLCLSGWKYRRTTNQQWIDNLGRLTGWDIDKIRSKMQ